MIAVLRKPVDRAISHFANKRHKDFSTFTSCKDWFDHHAHNYTALCAPLRKVAHGIGARRHRANDQPADAHETINKTGWGHAWSAAWMHYSQCVLSNPRNAIGRSLYGPQLFQWMRELQGHNLVTGAVRDSQSLMSRHFFSKWRKIWI